MDVSSSFPRKALVVDDDPISRKVLEAMLGTHSIHSVIAEDGFEALDLISRGTFACAFVDIFMPGMEGRETIRNLLAKMPAKAIVPMTGSSCETSRQVFEWAQRKGVVHTMNKPFSTDALAAIVKDIR